MRPELPVLIKARAKIADPAKWGKGIRGNGRRSLDTCCAAEAIEDCEVPADIRSAAFQAVRRGAGLNLAMDIVRWNDAHTTKHADVLAAFDKAIADAVNPTFERTPE